MATSQRQLGTWESMSRRCVIGSAGRARRSRRRNGLYSWLRQDPSLGARQKASGPRTSAPPSRIAAGRMRVRESAPSWPGTSHQQAARRAVDAAERSVCVTEGAIYAHNRLQACTPHRSQSARPQLYCERSEPIVGDGHHGSGTTERWLYLAVRVDLFSHRVVSWTMSGHIDEELVLATLQMAIQTRTASLLQQ